MRGLQAYLAFVETVKQGGFAGAARELGLTASAVAKSVGRLEQELGVRLLHRTTRRVSLTGDGEALYLRCQRIVSDIEALHDYASEARGEPRGVIRLSVPVVLGRAMVVPALAPLLERNEGLAVELDFSDAQADVVQDGLDGAIRIGDLPDSSLVARRIGDQTLVVCAAPAYLVKAGIPEDPPALQTHRRLNFRVPRTGRTRPWQFQMDGRLVEQAVESPYVMNDGEGLVAAAEAGLGLIQVPDYMAAHALEAGRLVEVLEGFRPPAVGIHLIYPSQRHVTARLRAVIDALVAGAPRRNVTD